MKRLFVLLLLACSLPVDAEATDANFFPSALGGAVECNGEPPKNLNPVPVVCAFKEDAENPYGKIDFRLTSWKEYARVTIKIPSPGANATITGDCENSFNADDGEAKEGYKFHPSELCSSFPPTPDDALPSPARDT